MPWQPGHRSLTVTAPNEGALTYDASFRAMPVREWWRAAVLLAAAAIFLVTACLVAASAADDTRLTAAEARKLKSPIPYTKKSIDRGRLIYSQNCTGCHGTDGKAEVAVIAEATDLTSPKLYKNGTTEGEILRSIRDGAGDQMPPFKSQIDNEEDIWQLVNFVRSLWPPAMRPPLLEDKGK
ncbi:MAG TPA: cytochrome c [Candidatus Acidoferrales bacterium]|jgi:mono/diheme cytochrome c family protein|nr:cytochrome c [Candidatus Acidoferrales bacterium]